MKAFIILVSLVVLSVPAFAQKEGRAAIRIDGDGVCDVNFYYGGEVHVLHGDLKSRIQYAGGSLADSYSNAMMQCHGDHFIELDETVVFDGGFCVLPVPGDIGTDDVNGVVNKGGRWLFTCSFPRYKEPSE